LTAPQQKEEPAERPDPAPACAMVIFGAGGDLTKRLLVPAIYNLQRTGLLPKNFYLLGVDRVDLTAEALRDQLKEAIDQFAHTRGKDAGAVDEAAWTTLAAAIDYVKGDITKPDIYAEIGERLAAAAKKRGTDGNVLFYLAVGDRFFEPVVAQLGKAGLAEQKDGKFWRRVVIEKPFGHDYETACTLNRQILSVLTEDQIYRIDHYLGKETVQNIMVFRFANGFFEPLWNRDHIDHIQITVAETVGVEQRGAFYERAGALRDMVPNHLFQLLSMTAMEPPNNFSADAVRTEKMKVLEATHLADTPDRAAVRGQYDAGGIGDKKYAAYRAEPNVAPDSNVETFVALKLMIDNWRWGGMPFYIRTGKALAHRTSEVVVQFKQAPFMLFRDTPTDRMLSNRMIIHIQPDEGVSLQFGAKVPGPKVNLGRVSMTFKYQDYFDSAPSTGYETLVYDCMIGDATLFQRADSVEAGWRIVQPVLDAWAKHSKTAPALYAAGSDGPTVADELLKEDQRSWHTLG